MHGPALGVIVQSVLEGMPLLPGEYSPPASALFPTPDARAGSVGVDPGRGGRPNSGGEDLKTKVLGAFTALPTPTTQDATNIGGPAQGRRHSPGLNYLAPLVVGVRDDLDPPGEQLAIAMPGEQVPVDWGPFAHHVGVWEVVMRRRAPYPVEPGPDGPRLSVRFVEWMQGLPDGWVSKVPDISYRQALTALGNGVVWQQAAAAIEHLREDR